MLDGTELEYIIVVDRPMQHTVLFYRKELLEACLSEPNRRDFFRRLGYPVDSGVDACLTFMKDKFRGGCPHEVGLFLGIPFKDVLGFMGLSDESVTCRSHWCIFGYADESLKIIDRHISDRNMVAAHLAKGYCPFKALAWRKAC